MKEKNKKYEYIDLFSGCGGLALGMHCSGWKAIFAVEKNQDAFSTLSFNLNEKESHFVWPKWLPFQTYDINKLIEEYKKQLSALSGKITLVAGGPPCQGFSTAGQRNEKDIRNQLVESYIKFIDLVTPDSVFFENVRGFDQAFSKTSSKKKRKKYSTYVVEELKKRGYNVAFKMINFADYGVPQSRVRFILFASKTLKPSSFFDILEERRQGFLKEKGLLQSVSIKDAISDLEEINGTIQCPDCKTFRSGLYGSPKTQYQRYCRGKKRKGQVPDSHRFAKHRDDTKQRFKELIALNIPGKNISDLLDEKYGVKKNCFSVLNADLPSPTLTSNPDDHIHYLEPRTLTVREYARIQSFPDWFEIKGKYTTGGECRKNDVPRYTQIGNAIPPLFAEQAGLALIELLNNRE